MIQTLLAHGAEQEPAGVAKASCADYEQLGLSRRVDQRRRGEVADYLAKDGRGPVCPDRIANEGIQRSQGIGLAVGGIEGLLGDRVVLVEEPPGEDRGQRAPANLSLIHSPADGSRRPGRFIDANHDATEVGSVGARDARTVHSARLDCCLFGLHAIHRGTPHDNPTWVKQTEMCLDSCRTWCLGTSCPVCELRPEPRRGSSLRPAGGGQRWLGAGGAEPRLGDTSRPPRRNRGPAHVAVATGSRRLLAWLSRSQT